MSYRIRVIDMLVAGKSTPGTLVAFALAVACGAQEPEVRRPMPDPIADVAGQDLYDRGLRLARTGDLLRAEQYVAGAIERGFPRARALPALLRICVAASRLNAALRYAEPFLRDHPEDARLRTLVASIHLGLGNVGDAQRHLEEAIATAPDDAPAHYLIGMLHREEHGDEAASDPYLRRYLELAPNGAHAAEVRAMLRRRAPARPIRRLIDPPAPPNAEEPSADPVAPEEASPT